MTVKHQLSHYNPQTISTFHVKSEFPFSSIIIKSLLLLSTRRKFLNRKFFIIFFATCVFERFFCCNFRRRLLFQLPKKLYETVVVDTLLIASVWSQAYTHNIKLDYCCCYCCLFLDWIEAIK